MSNPERNKHVISQNQNSISENFKNLHDEELRRGWPPRQEQLRGVDHARPPDPRLKLPTRDGGGREKCKQEHSRVEDARSVSAMLAHA